MGQISTSQIEDILKRDTPPWIDRYPGKYRALEQQLWDSVKQSMAQGLDHWLEKAIIHPFSLDTSCKHLIKIPDQFLFGGEQDFSRSAQVKRAIAYLNPFADPTVKIQSDTLLLLKNELERRGYQVVRDIVPYPVLGEYPPDYYLAVKVHNDPIDLSNASFR